MTFAKINSVLLSAFTISSIVLPAAAQAPDTLTAAVDGAYAPLLEQYDIPGMAVAVTKDGEHHFFNYGVAAKAAGTPVDERTIFEIGSVSKTFTATLGAYAAGAGKLSLDDHPSAFVPALAERAIDDATLLNLATYTAGGLPLQFPDSVTTDADAAAYYAAWLPDAAPGTQRRYSNPSIGLFGQVTAAALGGDFADLMAAHVFAPLGLADTFIRVPDAAMERYAFGIDKAGEAVRVSPGAHDAEAYGVKSTAADLIRFVDANISPETVAEPLRDAIDATHVGYFKSGSMVQGLGWEQLPYPVALERLVASTAPEFAGKPNPATALTPPAAPSGPTLFHKTGATGGFGAYIAFVPAERIGVVMLANRNIPNAARVTAAHAVLEALAAE